MTATGHAVIGTVIAATIHDPTIAIPLAVTSHVAADLFPHWDVATNKESKGWNMVVRDSVLDVVMGFIVSFLLVHFLFPSTSYAYVIVLIIAAQALDWLTAPYYFFKVKLFKPFYTFQKSFDNQMDKPWGIIGQTALIAVIIFLGISFYNG